MTERQFYKKAYQLIFIEGKTHQEVYDAEEKESRLGPESVARSISMVPSKEKYASLKGLISIFLGLIATVALIRLVVMFAFDQLGDMTISAIIFAVFLIVISPLMGVYGAMKAKPYNMAGASFFITICIVRGFFSEDFGSPAILYITLALGIGIYICGTMIPRRMRAAYTKHVVDKEKEDGKIVKRITYTFDETTRMSRKEVLKENF